MDQFVEGKNPYTILGLENGQQSSIDEIKKVRNAHTSTPGLFDVSQLPGVHNSSSTVTPCSFTGLSSVGAHQAS